MHFSLILIQSTCTCSLNLCTFLEKAEKEHRISEHFEMTLPTSIDSALMFKNAHFCIHFLLKNTCFQ